jgi:hypothetical protein
LSNVDAKNVELEASLDVVEGTIIPLSTFVHLLVERMIPLAHPHIEATKKKVNPNIFGLHGPMLLTHAWKDSTSMGLDKTR